MSISAAVTMTQRFILFCTEKKRLKALKTDTVYRKHIPHPLQRISISDVKCRCIVSIKAETVT